MIGGCSSVCFWSWTPCVDYVIVFTGIAGGAKARLLAATPLLMVLQIILLPVYLWLFAGAEAVRHIEPGPFVEAFVIIILIPLAAAAGIQAVARRHRGGRRVERGMAAARGSMCPTLARSSSAELPETRS